MDADSTQESFYKSDSSSTNPEVDINSTEKSSRQLRWTTQEEKADPALPPNYTCTMACGQGQHGAMCWQDNMPILYKAEYKGMRTGRKAEKTNKERLHDWFDKFDIDWESPIQKHAPLAANIGKQPFDWILRFVLERFLDLENGEDFENENGENLEGGDSEDADYKELRICVQNLGKRYYAVMGKTEGEGKSNGDGGNIIAPEADGRGLKTDLKPQGKKGGILHDCFDTWVDGMSSMEKHEQLAAYICKQPFEKVLRLVVKSIVKLENGENRENADFEALGICVQELGEKYYAAIDEATSDIEGGTNNGDVATRAYEV